MLLCDVVYQTIKERIVSGQYKPGQPLNEKEIIQELGVSRTPFREAIHALDQENLVQLFANRGIFVREITAKDLQDNFEIRLLLEPHAVAQICKLIPIGVIDTLIADSERALNGTYQDMLRVDETYHVTLIEYTENQRLKAILTRLHEQNKIQLAMYDASRVGRVSAERLQAVQLSLQEHLVILRAMKDQDADGAAAATVSHLKAADRRAVDFG